MNINFCFFEALLNIMCDDDDGGMWHVNVHGIYTIYEYGHRASGMGMGMALALLAL